MMNQVPGEGPSADDTMVEQNKLVRVAILDMNAGEPNEGMRCIQSLVIDFLQSPGISGNFQIFEVRLHSEIPHIDDFDIFISSGGPGSPTEEGEDWEKLFGRFLDDIWDTNYGGQSKKYLFLICHSYQLACLHWNLGEVTRRRSTAFGVMPVHKTAEGLSEPLLKGLSDPFYAVDSRDYQLIKPNRQDLQKMGGRIICMEKIRPHVKLERAVMGIRFSEEIFGVQFHPEADSEGMSMYFQQPEKREMIIRHHGKRKYLEMLEHLDDEDKILRTNRTIIPRFLMRAADTLDKAKLTTV
jgi:GMP synthase-like glutamine amidotransferase